MALRSGQFARTFTCKLSACDRPLMTPRLGASTSPRSFPYQNFTSHWGQHMGLLVLARLEPCSLRCCDLMTSLCVTSLPPFRCIPQNAQLNTFDELHCQACLQKQSTDPDAATILAYATISPVPLWRLHKIADTTRPVTRFRPLTVGAPILPSLIAAASV